MGILKKLTVLGAGLVVLFAVGFAVMWKIVTQPSALPLVGQQWWGPGDAEQIDPSIRPFKIPFSEQVSADLDHRLKHLPSITPALEGSNFRYGFNAEYLRKVIDFWLFQYKWQERVNFLNSLPQFTTQISGLQLHFVHAKPVSIPDGTQVVPLLLLHGWPSSVRFGYSEGAAKPGLGAAQIAVVLKSLMERLKFKEFYVHGGDAGAIIGAIMGSLYPRSVRGFHSNMCYISTPWSTLKFFLGSTWPSLFLDELSDLRMPLKDYFAFMLEETGYTHIQASKPDTVGIALQSSPAGLAAYILEKFSTWTNPDWRSLPDGGLTKKFSLTDLLDNVMIYWITGSITTSMRLYSETLNIAHMELQMDNVPVPVPTACAVFPNELVYFSKSILMERFPNLVRFTNMPRGGHFPALEEPQLLAEDIWVAVLTMRNLTSN
ncbi:juvenile hormone epoxide hydrolase 1 isoform X2 [Anabrus simplex]|uniref:juvenile hormone epoxide hydrolase 1 isoform X2 n=1 Tax=Anabrus simplex TaxID=316456 RepID=UPI0035A2C0A0